MEISVLALLGIGLATMFFGYFFGLFEGRGQGYRRHKKDELQERNSMPPAPLPAAPSTAAQRRRALLELATNDAGKAHLHMDGREVDSKAVTPDERRRLIDLMVMLRPWVEPGGSSTPGAAAPAQAARAPVPSVQSADSRVEKDLSAPTAPTGAPVGAATSLVGQIDSLLQARLVGSPLAEKRIHLAEAPHGGAVVFVGPDQYDGVDKVPDAEIQSAIRAAIAEWEEKFPPR